MATVYSHALANNENVKDVMGRARSTNGHRRNPYRVLVGKPEGKKATTKTKTQVGE
jgi:hypothetical protein